MSLWIIHVGLEALESCIYTATAGLDREACLIGYDEITNNYVGSSAGISCEKLFRYRLVFPFCEAFVLAAVRARH